MQSIVSLFATSQIQWIFTLIIVDVFLGVIAAFMKKDFRLGKVAGFMKRGVLKYILGFVILEIVTLALPSLSWMVSIAYILVILALVASMLDNLGKMGLPVPVWLRK